MFFRNILLLGIRELPNLIDLEPFAAQIHHDVIVVSLAGLADVSQELDHCVLGNTWHADRCSNGIALDKGRYDTHSFFSGQHIHTDRYA